MGLCEFEKSSCCDKTKCNEEQCIIAFKVYDQCRSKICLTPSNLGPARAAETTGCGCNVQFDQGEIIIPPQNAATVSICNLCVSNISILSKTPSPFRPGFWDVEVKYVFRYLLTFKNSSNVEISSVCAYSTYKTKVTLFGSCDTDIVMTTDLFDLNTISAGYGPSVTVEAKAIPLAAELRCPNCCGCNNCGCGCDCGCNSCGCDCGCGCNTCGCDCGCNNNCGCNSCGCDCGCSSCNNNCGCGCDNENDYICNGQGACAVDVTIGLFAIYKIFRPVNLVVESSGFCIPDECENISNDKVNPCDFFNSIEFPLNIFSPPGSCEFSKNSDCGCGSTKSNNKKCCC